jgi:tellurite resistance protein
MPQIFSVFQIVIDKDLSDLINKEGHNCHVKSKARIEAMMDGDVRLGIMHDCYTKVAEVAADDLEHVFEVGNIGPEDRITRLDKMHSISVGDIVADADGNCSVVCNVGFTPLAQSFHRLLSKELA